MRLTELMFQELGDIYKKSKYILKYVQNYIPTPRTINAAVEFVEEAKANNGVIEYVNPKVATETLFKALTDPFNGPAYISFIMY